MATLRRKHTSIGKPDIKGLASQSVHLGCSVSGGDGEQEGSFSGQILEWAGH